MANLIDNDAKVFTPDKYGYGHPTVVSFDNGTLFAGHINDSGNLEIHKSEDDGSTWVINNTIIPSVSIQYFNLCYRHTASVDEIFVLYSDGVNDYKVQKRDDGGSWSQILSFSITSNNKKALIRFERAGDYLQIFWVDGVYTKSKYSSNGGSAFSDGANQGMPCSAQIVDFDIDENTGKIYAVYGTCSTSPSRVFTRTGSQVSAPSVVDTSNYYYPNAFVNSAGSYMRIWYDNVGEDIRVVGYAGDLILLENTVIDYLAAGMDGDDNIYVFYIKSSDEKTYYKKYDATEESWGSEILLINTANNKFNCQKHSIPSSITLNYMYYTA